MIKNRILQFLNNEGMSPSQLAEVLGIQRSSISHILSGRNKPSYDFFSKLVKSYPNINLEWFFNGKGFPYKDNSDLNIPLKEEINPIVNFTNKKDDNSKVTNVNKIKEIIVLFTDGTFENYKSKL